MSAAAASSSAIPSVAAPIDPSAVPAGRATDVGVLAMDMYFPKHYVAQSDLETFNGVSAGKYTIGLGQSKMAFCTDREDIYSVCFSAVERFMRVNAIPYSWIGRVEVASETILDHSKAIKTHLMSLFEASGNSDVEGIDCMNACYAGTNALFNSAAWVESSAWDGRYALVVSADIAEYAAGIARPTGGCGAVVMLVGPGAPIVLERTRASHMENAWDFYKPHLQSPYPVVDGKFSNSCYLRSLDICYQRFVEKYAAANSNAAFSVIRDANRVLFHAPYNKLVQKSFARLLFNEFLTCPTAQADPAFAALLPFTATKREASYEDVPLEKAAVAVSKSWYTDKVLAGITIPQQLGNMYTASLYAGLMSLVSEEGAKLQDKRLLMFSYGSGLASTLFSLKVGSGPKVQAALESMAARADILNRLEDRTAVAPKEFNEWLEKREKLHTIEEAYKLEGSVDPKDFFKGAFYLAERDVDGKRKYVQL